MIEFQYELQTKEIEETLLCLAYKTEGWLKRFNLALLTIGGIYAVIKYAVNPGQILYMGFAAICTLFLFIQLYVFDFLRKKKAGKIVKGKNSYYFRVQENELVLGEKQEIYHYNRKNTKVFLSEHVISIHLGREILCIPRRLLTAEQTKELMGILKLKCSVRNIKTERNKKDE